MLDRAWEAGITTFDTAPGYGEAEALLGRWISQRGVVPHVATKLPSLAGVPDPDAPAAVDAALRASTKRLGLKAGDLPHPRMPPTISDRWCARTCTKPRPGARSARWGSRSTRDADVFAAIAAGPPHAIQLPVSALDQRMVTGGAIAACAAAGVTVFARSVFLQGALLMETDRLPLELAALRVPLMRTRHAVRRCEHDPGELGLALRPRSARGQFHRHRRLFDRSACRTDRRGG